MAGLKLITPPEVEPITVAFAKQFLRIDGDLQDDYVTHLVSVAREASEKQTNLGFISQTFREYFDGFPGCYSDCKGRYAESFGEKLLEPAYRFHRADRLELSRSPLVSVESVNYKDASGADQVLDPATYYVNDAMDPASIYRVPYAVWPITLRQVNSVWVEYEVGYSDDATKVPKTLIQAMLFGISHWFENRDLLQDSKQAEIPDAMSRLLELNQVYYQP